MASVFNRTIREVHVVGEHVSKGQEDSGFTVCAVHKRYLPLLLMTDGMRHNPEARITPVAKLRIRHRGPVIVGNSIRLVSAVELGDALG